MIIQSSIALENNRCSSCIQHYTSQIQQFGVFFIVISKQRACCGLSGVR